MINLSLKKIITWAILILGIYYLLTVIPKNKLEERDVLIITLVLSVIVADDICKILLFIGLTNINIHFTN